MARFTVSDCLEKIDNRFDMTLAAVVRARQLDKGSDLKVDLIEQDKAPVIALREIADGKVSESILDRIAD